MKKIHSARISFSEGEICDGFDPHKKERRLARFWILKTIIFHRFTRAEMQQLRSACLIFFIVILFGVVFFMRIESMGLVDALYFSWITSSTVGFGDLTPVRGASKLFSVLFLLLSTFSLGNLIGAYAEMELQRRQRAFRKKILQAKIDTKDLLEMDTSGDRKLSKDEYLVAMLRRTDLVPQEDIEAILERFAQLDADGNGFVDAKELDLPQTI